MCVNNERLDDAEDHNRWVKLLNKKNKAKLEKYENAELSFNLENDRRYDGADKLSGSVGHENRNYEGEAEWTTQSPPKDFHVRMANGKIEKVFYHSKEGWKCRFERNPLIKDVQNKFIDLLNTIEKSKAGLSGGMDDYNYGMYKLEKIVKRVLDDLTAIDTPPDELNAKLLQAQTVNNIVLKAQQEIHSKVGFLLNSELMGSLGGLNRAVNPILEYKFEQPKTKTDEKSADAAVELAAVKPQETKQQDTPIAVKVKFLECLKIFFEDRPTSNQTMRNARHHIIESTIADLSTTTKVSPDDNLKIMLFLNALAAGKFGKFTKEGGYLQAKILEQFPDSKIQNIEKFFNAHKDIIIEKATEFIYPGRASKNVERIISVSLESISERLNTPLDPKKCVEHDGEMQKFVVARNRPDLVKSLQQAVAPNKGEVKKDESKVETKDKVEKGRGREETKEAAFQSSSTSSLSSSASQTFLAPPKPVPPKSSSTTTATLPSDTKVPVKRGPQ